MDRTDRKKIRATAEAARLAASGSWSCLDGVAVRFDVGGRITQCDLPYLPKCIGKAVCTVEAEGEDYEAMSTHIATLDPDTTILTLDELDRKDEEIEQLKKENASLVEDAEVVRSMRRDMVEHNKNMKLMEGNPKKED